MTTRSYTATFSNGQIVEIAKSKADYAFAYQVQFQNETGEWDQVNGFAGDRAKAEKGAQAWVAKFNRTWSDKARKMVPCHTPTKVEIVAV